MLFATPPSSSKDSKLAAFSVFFLSQWKNVDSYVYISPARRKYVSGHNKYGQEGVILK